MKLTKEQFCNYINKYKEMTEQENDIVSVLGGTAEWIPSTWLSNYYEMLNDLCDLPEDKYAGTILDWFVFDTDFGSDDEMNIIRCSDSNKKWKINSPEVLYDYIKKEKEENK